MDIRKTVHDMVRLAHKSGGADDVAFDRLRSLGTPARDELIRMLGDAATPQDDAAIAIMSLIVVFPSSQSGRAIEEFATRTGDKLTQSVLDSARGRDPRWQNAVP